MSAMDIESPTSQSWLCRWRVDNAQHFVGGLPCRYRINRTPEFVVYAQLAGP